MEELKFIKEERINLQLDYFKKLRMFGLNLKEKKLIKNIRKFTMNTEIKITS